MSCMYSVRKQIEDQTLVEFLCNKKVGIEGCRIKKHFFWRLSAFICSIASQNRSTNHGAGAHEAKAGRFVPRPYEVIHFINQDQGTGVQGVTREN